MPNLIIHIKHPGTSGFYLLPETQVTSHGSASFTLILLLLCGTSVAGLFDAPDVHNLSPRIKPFAFDFQQNQHDLNTDLA